MSKTDEPQELAPIHYKDVELAQSGSINVSDLMWQTRDEGLIPLHMIEDSHLRNIALMLIGMGYQAYKATDGHKIRWLTVLRIEWEKRMKERKVTGFNSKKGVT